jgi:hypothetical protein
MKIKKIFSFIICLLATFTLAGFFASRKVDAAYYETSKNKVVSYTVNRDTNTVTIGVEYQNGLRGLEVYICAPNSNQLSCVTSRQFLTFFSDPTMDDSSNPNEMHINPREEIAKYDTSFSTPTGGNPINMFSDNIDENGKVKNDYKIMVKAQFCVVRTEDLMGCNTWSNASVILEETFVIERGYTGSAQINDTLSRMLYIANDIVIPVLWVILGVLLLVRGIMLGMDIVKSADEPEVRKKKVGGLIWLIVGVFVGYAVTIVASIVMSMFGFGGIF